MIYFLSTDPQKVIHKKFSTKKGACSQVPPGSPVFEGNELNLFQLHCNHGGVLAPLPCAFKFIA